MYRTKRAVIDGIKTRIRQRNGVDTTLYDAYLGYDPFSGKQKRLSSANLDDLKAQIDDFYAKYKVGGDAAVRLKASEAQDAREAEPDGSFPCRARAALPARRWRGSCGVPEEDQRGHRPVHRIPRREERRLRQDARQPPRRLGG